MPPGFRHGSCSRKNPAVSWSHQSLNVSWHCRVMRAMAIVGLLLLSFAQTSAWASTIICRDNDRDVRAVVERRLESADMVFLGKVLSESKPNFSVAADTTLPPIQSMREFAEYLESDTFKAHAKRLYQTTTFRVLQSWKGVSKSQVDVTNIAIPGQYGTYLELGSSYLVFAYEDEDQSLSLLTYCNSTIPANDAEERIEALHSLHSVAKPTDNALH
jgi:hypothetical protein